MDIKKLIQKGESETLEFKEKFNKETIETSVAFSNSKGGIVLIGVSDKGKIKGVDIGRKTLERVANEIKQNTDPQVYPSISVGHADNRNVIVVRVKESQSKPVFALDKVYKRVGRSNHRVSSDGIRKMALEGKKVYWDGLICENATLGVIGEEKIKRFLEKARFERRLDIISNISVKEALERLSLLRNGKLTNAAILLFGKNPQKFLLQAETRCARFKGTKLLEFIDMKVFGGDIIEQRDNAVEFVKEHIKLHAEIRGTERVEKWEYPIEAIREAVTNAICHRDYEISSNVQVRIFDDRIEIWGCGPLPEPLKIEDLKKKHDSILRNPLIGRCFFLIKYIEQWGTGTNRIIEWCLKYDLPEPIFEETSGSLVVTLRKSKLTKEFLEKMELNRRQKKAIEYIKEHKRITSRRYADLFGITARTARNDLRDLVNKEVIKRRGMSDKTAYYTLAEI